jgi:hypothetical protein
VSWADACENHVEVLAEREHLGDFEASASSGEPRGLLRHRGAPDFYGENRDAVVERETLAAGSADPKSTLG